MKIELEYNLKLNIINGSATENGESHSGGHRPIMDYCFNKRMNILAAIFGNEIIYIYKKSESKNFKNQQEWILCSELIEHHSRITGIDWNKQNDNILVSCGSDLNVYVWVCNEDECWKPTFVLIHINRAATCVKWSPNGKRFAVGSAARTISICNYEQCDDIWVSRKVKRAGKGTITCLDWHPDNKIIVVGCVDGKLRIFGVSEHSTHGKFGEQLLEINSSAWLCAVKFSTELSDHSFLLAYSAHNSSVGIIRLRQENGMWAFSSHKQEKYCCLPFTSLDFALINDKITSIIAAGYDCRFASIDHETCFMEWLSKENETSIEVERKHKNCITKLRTFNDKNGECMLSSSGLDGNIYIWKVV
ncbi:hypothetical protein GJ496_010222 [Pomphorhynchus laevis]|nr:hypothetical protein GJ496_010222 [Pomphorhynchus laevis]